MNTIELLAPAGNMECFQAAISSGADAVYFGVGTHNARASATNFTIEEAYRAIDYAHVLGVRSYITLNTLILDREMEEIVKMAECFNAAGADAMIIQDIGLLRALRNHLSIPLHASTQMSIHNLAGVNAAKEMGLSRAVLARELALEEILVIQKSTPIELEMFVHGAMCVSASGQCLHSSFLGGRSGNRGTCAQPCRLKYQIHDGKPQNWLSMKDLCLLDSIDELKQAGVTSIKIEGRMKPVTYVTETVRAYRKAIDGEKEIKQDKERLQQVFNRGGFVSGYAANTTMIDRQYNGHRGICVGKVEKNNIFIEKDLYAGDIISTDLGDKTKEWRVRENLVVGKHPMPFKWMQSGDQIWRLHASKQEEEVQSFLHQVHRTVPIDIECRIAQDKKAVLTCLTVDGRACVTIEGDVAQVAKNAGLTNDKVAASLSKLGDTPFHVHSMKILLNDDMLFLPNSSLNALRREAVSQLEIALSESYHREEQKVILEVMPRLEKNVCELSLIAQCMTLEQAESAVYAGANAIYAQPRVWNESIIQQWSEFARNNQCYLHFPPILQGDAIEKVTRVLKDQTLANFQGAVAGNYGTIEQFRAQFSQWVGDYTLNITNRFAAREIQELGISRVALSAELTTAQIRDIIQTVPESEVVLYGTLPSMNLRYCPMRESNNGTCITNCAQGEMLIDRKQEAFCMLPFTFSRGDCLIQILNAHCIDGLKYFDSLRACGASAWRLAFYQETPEAVQERIQAYCDALNGKTVRPIKTASGGHFGRGIT